MSGVLYRYFVEGDCEKALLIAFMHSEKTDYAIKPGKIDVFNVILQKFSPARVMTFKKGTKLVFIYDTDIKNTDILEENIEMISRYSNVSEDDIVFLQSVKTLEDEIVRSSEFISDINDLFNTKGLSEFKKKFIKHSDIISKLLSVGFSLEKMWNTKPPNIFTLYKGNVSSIIEKNKKVTLSHFFIDRCLVFRVICSFLVWVYVNPLRIPIHMRHMDERYP